MTSIDQQDKICNIMTSLVDRFKESHKGRALRYFAVLHLNNKDKLEEIAKTDQSPIIRREAVQRIEDPAQLYEIALHDIDPEVKKSAINRLNDKKLLILLRLQLSSSYQLIIKEKILRCR